MCAYVHPLQGLLSMSKPNLLSCYQKVATLQEKLPLLQQRFGFSNMTAVIDRAELELQQVHTHSRTHTGEV